MSRQNYSNQLAKAKRILKKIDIHDANLLALALKLDIPIWSQDKHFQKIKTHLTILKTEDFWIPTFVGMTDGGTGMTDLSLLHNHGSAVAEDFGYLRHYLGGIIANGNYRRCGVFVIH